MSTFSSTARSCSSRFGRLLKSVSGPAIAIGVVVGVESEVSSVATRRGKELWGDMCNTRLAKDQDPEATIARNVLCFRDITNGTEDAAFKANI